jgi:predicted phosphodiesterase
VKAKIISDQHLEFRVCNGNYRKYFNAVHPRNAETAAEVCIVAGDFDELARHPLGMFKELCDRERQVLFVPGNHEYYGARSMAAVDDMLDEVEQKLPNFVVLRTGRLLTFCGRRFLGDTMWVPKTAALMLSADQVNDSRNIPELLDEIATRYSNFTGWLSSEVRPGDVVVTHHLPSERSVPAEYRSSPVQPWFLASGAESLFKKELSVWIHGHTHQRCDYVLNNTRVICNPVGYPNEIGKLPGRLAPFTFNI